MAKRAVVSLPVEFIQELLGIPEGVEVLHVVPSNYGLALDLVITAPDMRDMEAGAQPTRIAPLFVRADGHVRIESINYPREQRAEEGV